MDCYNLAKLFDEVARKRKSFPFIKFYQKLWAIVPVLEREAGNNAEAADFLKEVKELIKLEEQLLDEQSSNAPLDKEAIGLIVTYGCDVVADPYYEEKDRFLARMNAYYDRANGILNNDGKVMILYLIVSAYRVNERPWRGKGRANELSVLLHSMAVLAPIYEALSSFYKLVLDFGHASEIAYTGADVHYQKEDKKSSAKLYAIALSCSSVLPDFVPPSEEEIRAKYGEEAETVLNYPRLLALKQDPVVATKEFQDAYDDVMEEAMDLYEKGPKIPQALWGYMEEGFAARGIVWRNPQLMNPTSRFD